MDFRGAKPGRGATVAALILAGVAGACRTAPPAPPPMPAFSETPILDAHARERLVLLAAINGDRRRAGLQPVGLDSLATAVAQAHAEAMAEGRYLSHYERNGSAPYDRYAEAGGTAHVRENVFRRETRGENPRRPGESRFDVREAERWLMTSPGHRAAILDPHATAVGLGIADTAGSTFVVQEFLSRHAALEVPAVGWTRAPTPIRGRMLDAGVRPLLLYLAREPDVRAWQRGGGPPPRGPYPDGEDAGLLVPAWGIRWNRTDRSFEIRLQLPTAWGPGRYYGVLFVAPEERVRAALGDRAVDGDEGWPGAAFVLEVL